MNQETVLIILSVLGSVFAFYLKIKKDILAEEEQRQTPIKELNISIIKLNSSIDFLNRTIESLKERVSNHGKEIEEIKAQVIVLEEFRKHIMEAR